MHFTQARLDPHTLSAAQASRISERGIYGVHQVLWQLFSNGRGEDREQPRPFLYRAEGSTNAPTFYVVSTVPPRSTPGWSLSVKDYAPRLTAGQQLAFDLRANPVRRSRDAQGRQHRHDVVMHAKRQQSDADAVDAPARVTSASLQWLRERERTLGFEVDADHFAADGYVQHHIPGKRAIRFSTTDMRGLLTVTDVEAMRAALFQGVGPSKAFGCGLLLVRPAWHGA